MLLVLIATCLLPLVNSQCTPDQFNNEVVGMLTANSMIAGSQGSAPTVTVLNFTIVCLSLGTAFSNFRTASVVVQYNCTGAELWWAICFKIQVQKFI